MWENVRMFHGVGWDGTRRDMPRSTFPSQCCLQTMQQSGCGSMHHHPMICLDLIVFAFSIREGGRSHPKDLCVACWPPTPASHELSRPNATFSPAFPSPKCWNTDHSRPSALHPSYWLLICLWLHKH